MAPGACLRLRFKDGNILKLTFKMDQIVHFFSFYSMFSNYIQNEVVTCLFKQRNG